MCEATVANTIGIIDIASNMWLFTALLSQNI